jgi:class 3 adenylate cyclase
MPTLFPMLRPRVGIRIQPLRIQHKHACNIKLISLALSASCGMIGLMGEGPMDIAEWLRDLGLTRYERAFRENAIDSAVLPSLTAEDLKDLGVTLVGHRRRLLDAIAALRSDAAIARDTGAPSQAPPMADAERRQLTVMFCDLVGSTALSAQLDPEDLREIIGAYHRTVTDTVEGFGGFVARYMGDGVLIHFGYPQAHEDDAERAARCGLAVVDRVSQLNLAERLHTRIGIATGLVVVGGEVVEHDVIGETPNLAARLQALAEPDAVVIAAGTRRLVGDLFEYRGSRLWNPIFRRKSACACCSGVRTLGTECTHLAVETLYVNRARLMIFNHDLPPDDDGGAAWSEAAARVPSPQRPELRSHTIGHGAELADPEGRWQEFYGVERGGAVLVHPDEYLGRRS